MSRYERGVTLLSVIVALVILATGLMALARVQADLVRARRIAEAKSTAVSVARSYMEDLRSRDPATLADEGPVSLDERGQIVPVGPYVGRVVVQPAGADIMQLRVLVDVPGTRTNTQVELVSLVYTGVP